MEGGKLAGHHDIEIADGMYAVAGQLALDAQMADVRATKLLPGLPEGKFFLKLKFLLERTEVDWVIEDKLDQSGLSERKDT